MNIHKGMSRYSDGADQEVRGDTITPERYTSQEFMEAENEKLWPKVWHLGGVLADLEETGDYIRHNFGRESIIMVKQSDGSVKAFFNVCPHRGNRLVLDAFESALAKRPTADHRFRVEHAQVLHSDDIPRFAQLGVIPSMQAVHQTSDMYWIGKRLGPTRELGAYAWRSLIESGVVIPNGSDFPVEQVNPLISFKASVSRQDAQNWPAGGWHPPVAVPPGRRRGRAHPPPQRDPGDRAGV